MCDTESSPNFTQDLHAEQRRERAVPQHDPKSPNYLGKSPGNAFMELQFYEPGWVAAVRRLRLQRHASGART